VPPRSANPQAQLVARGGRATRVPSLIRVATRTEGSPFIVCGSPPSRTNTAILSHHYTAVPGLAVAPVGLRMLWREGKFLKPSFTAKEGASSDTLRRLSHPVAPT
jgi:hypothetical protein